MKKLKFEHQLAELIAKGEKRSTWRLFDDKDLSVGDDVEFIDKVKSNNPETWRPFGVGKIRTVIEKHFSDIDDSDFVGHEAYTTKGELLKTYKKYYGPNVTGTTVVKIIHFDFHPLDQLKDPIVDRVSPITAVKVYADGGSRGNPGPSASGFVLIDVDDTIVVDKGIYLGITTNNQAEYQALKFGLEEAIKMNVKSVDVYMDSLLVINQMKGIFKVKNRDLWPIHEAIKKLSTKFERISFTHVPRELNKLADAAVNRTLDEALHSSSKNMP